MCDSQYNLILYMRDLGEDYIHSWLFILQIILYIWLVESNHITIYLTVFIILTRDLKTKGVQGDMQCFLLLYFSFSSFL